MPHPFRFKLRALLIEQKQVTQKAQEAYSKALRLLEAKKTELKRYQAHKERVFKGINAQETQVFLPQLRQSECQYTQFMEASLLALRERLKEAETSLGKAQSHYLEQKQRLDKLESLREKALRAHSESLLRAEENALMDLINTSARSRKGVHEG